MKLLWSSRSPFVRKVMIAAHELGLAQAISTERVVVDAARPNASVMAVNPLGRIPTLVLADGTVLHDSHVIAEYLDHLAGGNRLFPPPGPARWRALARSALADGIMEADLRWLEERNLPEAQSRAAMVAACRLKIGAALDACEPEPGDGAGIGEVALASAIAHLDFRFPDLGWRSGRPNLSRWFDGFSARPSMVATAFVDRY